MTSRIIPVDSQRQDWPRLVAQTTNRSAQDIAFLKAPPPTVITGNTTLTLSDRYALVDASGGAVTVTLPAAADSTGAVFTVKKTDTSVNAVTIDANASELIDGSTTSVISIAYIALTIYCDGTKWHIV